MVERLDYDEAPRPLPRDWLPEAVPPEGAPEWEARAQRIIAAAEPPLRRLGDQRLAVDATWSTRLGSWWKPAAVMAVAAAALLVLIGRSAILREASPGSLPLSVVAAQGEPFALWEALGIDADPVLALIAMQEQDR